MDHKISVKLTFRNFLKGLIFRIVMAAAGIGLVVLLALVGDFFDIGLLQSTGGIVIVLLVGGPLLLISTMILLYTR